MSRQADASFRTAAKDAAFTDAHRRETQQAVNADGGFGVLHKIVGEFVTVSIELHHLDPPSVVAAMPLHVDIAFGIGALAEGGRVLLAGVLRDFADDA